VLNESFLKKQFKKLTTAFIIEKLSEKLKPPEYM
jgi:hypothetical protein